MNSRAPDYRRLLVVGEFAEGDLPATPNCVFAPAAHPEQALEIIQGLACDAVYVKLPLTDWEPAEFLEHLQQADPRLPCIFEGTPAAPVGEAVDLVKLGAFHYLPSNPQPEHLADTIESALEYRSRLTPSRTTENWRKYLVGASPAMRGIVDTIRLVATRRCTVLITGETGTGKEMVARALHGAGNRAHLPLVAVNCAALPENLLEAELFGHVRGAFTGAVEKRVGRFEQANHSTLFLDEIADMPLDLQSKLLRVLQEREFQRLGSSESIRVDVRVIAATNVDLLDRVAQGKFREDLYYRLNVVPLEVPPLRARPGDIALLVHHFIEKICRQEEIPPKRVSRETIDRLSRYAWPGNVRQLENAVEMAIALSGDREMLFPGDFALPVHKPVASAPSTHISVPEHGIDFEEVVGSIERSLVEQALRRTNGNKKLAAELLRLNGPLLRPRSRAWNCVRPPKPIAQPAPAGRSTCKSVPVQAS